MNKSNLFSIPLRESMLFIIFSNRCHLKTLAFIIFYAFHFDPPDKFGGAMTIVKSDIGGNITVRDK